MFGTIFYVGPEWAEFYLKFSIFSVQMYTYSPTLQTFTKPTHTQPTSTPIQPSLVVSCE